MAARLRQFGFNVVVRENATRAHVASAIAAFTAKTTPSTGMRRTPAPRA